MSILIINIVVIATIIACLIGAVFLYKEVIDPYTIFGSIVAAVVSLLVATFVWFLLLVVTVSVAQDLAPTKETIVPPVTSNLKVLNSANNSISGRFFLGSSTIDSTPSIQYVTEGEDGAIRIETVPADGAIIYERDIDQPTVTVKKTIEKVDLGILGETTKSETLTYEFIIPKNSIQNNYDVMKK